MSISLDFLGWDRPLVELAAEKLRTCGRGRLPVDFSHLLIAVPTMEASRLLREKLAELCDKDGGAVNLRITLPERLLRTDDPAGQEQVLAAWLKTLRRAKNDDFPELFRNRVLERFGDSAEILLGWGEALQSARMTLALEGCRLEAAKEKLDKLCRQNGSENREIHFTRFAEFAALEKLYLDELAGIAPRRPDPAVALLRAAEHPQLPAGVERVILIDCADLTGGPAKFLAAADADVECWINAPEKYRDAFDAFGRPKPKFWNAFPVDLDPATHVRIVPRPNQQAKKIVELLKNSPRRPSAIAVLDPEVADALETHSKLDGGIEFFIPRETPLSLLPWSRLLLAILRSATDDLVADAATVWDDPMFADYAKSVLHVDDLAAALRRLDGVRREHLAAKTDLLRKIVFVRSDAGAVELAKLIRDRDNWSAEIKKAAKPVSEAYRVLAKIGMANQLKHLDLRRSENELASLKTIVAALDKLDISAADSVALLRRMIATTRSRFRDESPDAIDVVGFLEVPWRSDPTVLIAGFNDGFMAKETNDDQFLPEQAREELELTGGRQRRAADVLRFSALLKRTDGEVYLLLGSSSQNGDRLLPARLLLQCGDSFENADELARRTQLLFDEKSELIEEPAPPANAPPMMQAPRVELPTLDMNITGFKAYLECPFTFFLTRIRGAERCEVDAAEINNADLGTLVHNVLQKCGEMTMESADSLESQLAARLDHLVEQTFGWPPPGLVGLQRDMIRESLHYFAAAQYAEYGKGWRIVKEAAECKLDVRWDDFYHMIFQEAPREDWRTRVMLKAKIDRIDVRRREDGLTEARVLDYKTASDGKPPQATHFCASGGEADEYRLVRGVDGEKCWSDLQLPLYVLLTRHCLAGGELLPDVAEVGAGYFLLPSVLTNTRVAMFDELADPETLESAAECADNVLRRIFVDGKFWPPAKSDFECFPSARIAVSDFLAPESPQKPEDEP